MRSLKIIAWFIAGLAGADCALAAVADSPPVAPAPAGAPAPAAPAYADLADLADSAPLVIRAQVSRVIVLEPGRARGVMPGRARALITARTEGLLGGQRAVGEALSYLADLPLDARNRPPKLKKQRVLLFARSVPGRPGELQLVAPDAQLAWSAPLEERVRALLAELYAPGAPPRITGVREALHVPGNLAGSGETQIFLGTATGEPAAISIVRQPGAPARLGVSFSELVGASGELPPRSTLGWYRLACFLPAALPPAANVAADAADRAVAALDYRTAISALGPCGRTRGPAG